MRLLVVLFILTLFVSIGGPLLHHHLSAKETRTEPAQQLDAPAAPPSAPSRMDSPEHVDTPTPSEAPEQPEAAEQEIAQPLGPVPEPNPIQKQTLAGVVLDADEWTPIPGVQVFAIPWDDSLVNHHSIFKLQSRAMAITDDEGRFKLTNLRLTRYGLITYHDTYIQTESAIKHVLDPESTDESAVITMEEGGAIAGMASFGGKPLTGQQITLVQLYGTRETEAVTTDETGEYNFEGLREGRVKVAMVVSSDIGPLEIAFSVRVETGKIIVLDLPLQGRDAAIFGRVTPYDPKKQYEITATNLEDPRDTFNYTAEIGSDGSFLFSQMPYGRIRVIVEARQKNKIQRRKYESIRAVLRTFPGMVVRHDFYFSNGSIAEGIVPNVADDEPLLVLANKEMRIDDLNPGLLQKLRGSASTYEAYVDVNGGFRFEGLHPGTYQIIAEGGPNRYGMATIHVTSKPSNSRQDAQPGYAVELWLEDN